MNEYNRFFPYKILMYSDKLKEIAEDKIPTPVILHIYPTNECNNNCTFCIMKDEKKNRVSLSNDTFNKTIIEAARIGVKLIHFSGGGEPTQHPYLLDAIKLTRHLGMKVAISTNGSFYSDDLVKYCNHIRVSLNAGTEKTYNSDMRPTGHTFKEVCSNISKMVQYKKDNMIESCDIGIGFVLSNSNYKDVYEFCKLSDGLDVDFVHIRPAFLGKNDKKVKEIVPIAFKEIEKAKKKMNVKIFAMSDKFEGFWTPKTYTKCRSTPLIAVLNADAKFSVCQDVFLKFGDMNTQSFEEIWNSDEHKKVIESINLKQCPRCVNNRVNEIIEHMFINDDTRIDLI